MQHTGCALPGRLRRVRRQPPILQCGKMELYSFAALLKMDPPQSEKGSDVHRKHVKLEGLFS